MTKSPSSRVKGHASGGKLRAPAKPNVFAVTDEWLRAQRDDVFRNLAKTVVSKLQPHLKQQGLLGPDWVELEAGLQATIRMALEDGFAREFLGPGDLTRRRRALLLYSMVTSTVAKPNFASM